MDDIAHLGPSGDGLEVVLMMPEPVGPRTLLIDEHDTVDDVGNLGDPEDPQTGHGDDVIGHDEPGVHRRGSAEVGFRFSEGGVIVARLRGSEKNAHASSRGIGRSCRDGKAMKAHGQEPFTMDSSAVLHLRLAEAVSGIEQATRENALPGKKEFIRRFAEHDAQGEGRHGEDGGPLQHLR